MKRIVSVTQLQAAGRGDHRDLGFLIDYNRRLDCPPPSLLMSM